ncbi:MAG: hypothetical protein ACR2L2_06955 [Acidobacteriota bacterium]
MKLFEAKNTLVELETVVREDAALVEAGPVAEGIQRTIDDMQDFHCELSILINRVERSLCQR